jgi:hypothetical protein
VNCPLLQLTRVDFGHVRKSWAQPRIIRATQRIHSHQVQVIANHHQRTLAQVIVDAAGSIGEHQGLDAKQAKRTHGKGHLLKGVSFVIVNSALHRQYGHVAHLTHHQTSGMALGGGGWKPRYLGIRNRDRVLELIRKVA